MAAMAGPKVSPALRQVADARSGAQLPQPSLLLLRGLLDDNHLTHGVVPERAVAHPASVRRRAVHWLADVAARTLVARRAVGADLAGRELSL